MKNEQNYCDRDTYLTSLSLATNFSSLPLRSRICLKHQILTFPVKKRQFRPSGKFLLLKVTIFVFIWADSLDHPRVLGLKPRTHRGQDFGNALYSATATWNRLLDYTHDPRSLGCSALGTGPREDTPPGSLAARWKKAEQPLDGRHNTASTRGRAENTSETREIIRFYL